MEASVSGRGGQDENSAFRPSRRLNSTAAMPHTLSADTERKIGLPDGYETGMKPGIPWGTFRGLVTHFTWRPRREIALRFAGTWRR